jgi:prepilin peptidase CpaA
MMEFAQFAALAVAVTAAGWDLRTRRIPNVLTFGAALAGLGYHVVTGGLSAVASSAAGWALGALVFIVPFALKGLGGGDVKLLAALGAWLGPADVIWVALYTGVAGGILAIVVALTYGYLRQALSNVWLLLCHWRVAGMTPVAALTLESSRAPKLAYAVPILMGMVMVLWQG